MSDSQTQNRTRLEQAVEAAELAFWREIAAAYPEAASGDFPPDATLHFTAQLTEGANLWLRLNAPSSAVLPPPYQYNEKLGTLLRQAVNTTGSLDPNECLYMVEEQLTSAESDAAVAFLTWCLKEDHKFGWNIQDVFSQFIEEAGNPASPYHPDNFSA